MSFSRGPGALPPQEESTDLPAWHRFPVPAVGQPGRGAWGGGREDTGSITQESGSSEELGEFERGPGFHLWITGEAKGWTGHSGMVSQQHGVAGHGLCIGGRGRRSWEAAGAPASCAFLGTKEPQQPRGQGVRGVPGLRLSLVTATDDGQGGYSVGTTHWPNPCEGRSLSEDLTRDGVCLRGPR